MRRSSVSYRNEQWPGDQVWRLATYSRSECATTNSAATDVCAFETAGMIFIEQNGEGSGVKAVEDKSRMKPDDGNPEGHTDNLKKAHRGQR